VSIPETRVSLCFLSIEQEAQIVLSGHDRIDGHMSNSPNSETKPGQPTVYQIRIQGHLDDQWREWFEGLAITQEEDGDTLLTGPVVDQAALHGLLRKIRDLGTPLISVNRVKPARSKGRNQSELRGHS
jgi:hypothetical protein